MAGMEHWLPLLEERLATLFDHLGEHDLDRPRRRRRQGARGAARRDRGLLPEPRPGDAVGAGQLSPARAGCALPRRKRNGTASSPNGRSTSPRPSPSPNRDRIHRFRVEAGARFRARARAAGERLRSGRGPRRRLRKSGRKVVLASYTSGARERLSGLLEDHGLKSAQDGRHLAGRAGLEDPAGAARPPARSRLHHPRRRGPHRAGHARRPPRPPPQEAQGRRRLPRRAGDALAGRPRGPRRPRHRPLRGPDADPGQQGAARLRRARICARQQALRAGREYRAARRATAATARA